MIIIDLKGYDDEVTKLETRSSAFKCQENNPKCSILFSNSFFNSVISSLKQKSWYISKSIFHFSTTVIVKNCQNVTLLKVFPIKRQTLAYSPLLDLQEKVLCYLYDDTNYCYY